MFKYLIKLNIMNKKKNFLAIVQMTRVQKMCAFLYFNCLC